jgi:hypothetical protein
MKPGIITFALYTAVLGMGITGACTGEGKTTTPQKMVDYTERNVKRSAKDAPAAARRTGKRITRAVGSTPSDEGDASDASDGGGSK